MQEAKLQKKILTYCRASDILAVKVDSTSRRGWPDLLILTPNGQTAFIELKTPRGVISPIQHEAHKQIARRKGLVYVVRSIEQFEALPLIADARAAIRDRFPL